MSQPITVLIPCKNERDNILECIKSARFIADEILVADSGSTDETLQIVGSMDDCRLIQGEWNGYSEFKNWAIPQSTYPWVLILDADERVTEELASEIRQQLACDTTGVDAWRVWFKTYFMGHELRHTNWNNGSVRLIRRDVCRYQDRLVHENFDINPKRLRKLRNRLTHYTIRNYEQYFEKYLRYTELGARQLHCAGRRATVSSLLFRPFLRFFYLYVLRGGFLDGRVGIQVCMLRAFFNTFLKQARLWEREELGKTEEPVQTDNSAQNATERQVPTVIEFRADTLHPGSKAA